MWTIVLVFALTFVSPIGAVRDWTDVKVSVAIAAVVCVRSRRLHMAVALGGLFLGHLVLGAFFDVVDRPVAAWMISGVVAGVGVVVLVRILRPSIVDSGDRLPAQRIFVFIVGAAGVAIIGGFVEFWLLDVVDATMTASPIDMVFGLAIALCLAAIAVTRSGRDWLTSVQQPGSELLAPLMVVLVTLVAVQVSRQVWSQRDDDRIVTAARSVQSAVTSRWDRELQVLQTRAESIAPAVAFDVSTFQTLVEQYLEQNEVAVAASLSTRSASAGSLSVIETVYEESTSTQWVIANDEWANDVVVVENSAGDSSRDDETAADTPLILHQVDLVPLPDGVQLVLVVAYSITDLLREVTTDLIDGLEDFEIGVVHDGGASTPQIWAFDSTEGRIMPSGGRSDTAAAGSIAAGGGFVDFTVGPAASFGSSASTLLLIMALEVGVGVMLCGVLILGANAQFKMLQERRGRENLLEAALDATPGFSVVFDNDFRVLAANRPVRVEFAGHIPGLEVARIFGLESDSGRRRMVEDILRRALGGQPAHIEIAEDTGDRFGQSGASSNPMKIIELSAYPVTSPGGEPIGFLHGVDATERRNLAMRSAQSERMESLGALAGGLAHDFNNLLFVTLGNLQLMSMNDTVLADEKLSKFVSRSMTAVERGAEITKSLLAVARSQPLEESAVSLSELVKGILPLVRQALGSGRRVEVDISDPHLQLMVDSGRLSSCILNLAFNSRDAMGPNGVLQISARLDETSDMIELSISDDGEGMPEDVVSRAFEPFFTTKSAGSGTGLGLATVYAFAKQSGGTAYLESHIGVGTTVTLVLPRFSGVATARESVTARRSGRRVVVADDEQSLAEMVASWLIDMGVDARFATSPKAALALIEEFEPDVLVSDANFGEELDGIELARLGTAIVPDMAVVFMTGYSTSMRELQELGEQTLAKPFSREDLYAALSPLIAEEDSTPQDQSTKSSNRKRGRTS